MHGRSEGETVKIFSKSGISRLVWRVEIAEQMKKGD